MKRIRVIIRDSTPSVLYGEPAAYRSVVLELAPEQQAQLKLQDTGQSNGTVISEVVTSLFFD